MTTIHFAEQDLDAIAEFEGRVAVVIPVSGKLDSGARRVNRLTRGALKRFVDSDAWEKMKSGSVVSLAWPARDAAKSVDIRCLDRGADAVDSHKAGAALAKTRWSGPLLVLATDVRRVAALA